MKKITSIIKDLEKAKYIKREGTPGNYKYTYADVSTGSSPREEKKENPVSEPKKEDIQEDPKKDESRKYSISEVTEHAQETVLKNGGKKSRGNSYRFPSEKFEDVVKDFESAPGLMRVVKKDKREEGIVYSVHIFVAGYSSSKYYVFSKDGTLKIDSNFSTPRSRVAKSFDDMVVEELKKGR